MAESIITRVCSETDDILRHQNLECIPLIDCQAKLVLVEAASYSEYCTTERLLEPLMIDGRDIYRGEEDTILVPLNVYEIVKEVRDRGEQLKEEEASTWLRAKGFSIFDQSVARFPEDDDPKPFHGFEKMYREQPANGSDNEH
jgi:hypothetical protein